MSEISGNVNRDLFGAEQRRGAIALAALVDEAVAKGAHIHTITVEEMRQAAMNPLLGDAAQRRERARKGGIATAGRSRAKALAWKNQGVRK